MAAVIAHPRHWQFECELASEPARKLRKKTSEVLRFNFDLGIRALA
jgi:hypothetical protein